MTRRSAAERRFTAVVADASPDLLAYFERRVGADAADLLADTLMVAWRRIDDLPRDAEAARMWLFGVARNVLRNAARGELRRHRVADALRGVVAMTARHDHVEAIAMRDLVDRLDPDLAEVITLAHWEGLTLVQIGQVLGVPASTVRGRYRRAKAALRVQLSMVD